jgi:transglutaminase-like putative cysteine protease
LVFIAAAMVVTAAWAVGATGWTDRLNVVVYAGLGAVVIGLMLSRSLLPGSVAHIFSIVIGVAWSFWITSRLLPADYTWFERWTELVLRLNDWYNQAIQGGVSRDNLMFVLQMSVIVWGMGYLMIWFLFRSRTVWPAIVPGGLVLIINLYYAPNDITFWFLIYLLLSLLLVIRFNLFDQQTKWRTKGVFFQPDISFDFLRDGLIFSALVIGLAWLAPPVVPDRISLLDEFQGSWQDFQGHWNRLFADLNYRNTGRLGSFGRSLTLGGPRHLTDEPVMDVWVQGSGRYWRAAVYDAYTGQGWRNTDEESAGFGPETSLALPRFVARVPITQTYTFYHDGSTALYAMSNPVYLNRTAKVTFNAIPAKYSVPSKWPTWIGSKGPWVEEITYIRSNAAVDKGENYLVVSAVSQATLDELREAGPDYPVWVTERYLELPDTITERTRQLARTLTEPFDDPFSKARAIERYMRTEIKYNEQIAAPPSGVDKVDYILFERQEAYCDYYASAMIVMLRSVGIPARLAVGFAQGDYDKERGVYHVVNADAHSWVEVYFPRYGWIEFEPTAAQPAIVRPVAPDNDDASTGDLADVGPMFDDGRIPGKPEEDPLDEEIASGELPAITLNLSLFGAQISVPWSVITGGMTVIGVVLLAGLAVVGFWWRQQEMQANQSIFNLYQTMVRLASWMGAGLRPWQTPYEHATVLQNQLPTLQSEVETITDEYVHYTFSPPGVEQDGAQSRLTIESSLAWRRLRPEMIKTALKRRLRW